MPNGREERVISSPAAGMYRVHNLYFDPISGRLIVEYEIPRGGNEVAIQSMQLDPNAQSYTDDEIAGKVNNASAQITRASSVAAAARPLEDDEVTSGKVADGVAKANLDAMTDTARGYVKTSPTTGQFKIIAVERQADGKLKVEYDDVAI
jgi:hypothetical protein